MLLLGFLPLFITLDSVPVVAQTGQSSVDEYNVPKEIETCIRMIPGVTINGDINPFYLSGDFDGDGKLDFAVQVAREGSKGVLICLSSRKIPLLVGAGSSTIWPASQKWRFDAWSIVPKESSDVSRPPKAHHDAILLDVKEAASGLLYWDGAVLRWEQLSD
jgi:hypothetical protein